jgi:hypothetical protein
MRADAPNFHWPRRELEVNRPCWGAEPRSRCHFMFTRAGVPVGGAMGDVGEGRANNTWKPFFATEDIERTLDS